MDTPTLLDGLKATGAPLLWERPVRETLSPAKRLVPAGSQVLEIGYGDGLLTCYLCQELGWCVVGLEIDPKARQLAEKHARQYGLSDQVEFLCNSYEAMYQHHGMYDCIFIKTVLYHAPTLDEYARWLDWIVSRLRPGGIFINFETGRANALTQLYRRVRRRSYTDLCLYTREVEALYDSRFEILYRRYYGGWSQFLAPVPALYFMASRVEEALRPRHADNSFIVSMIARHPG
jgi:protein-L-isoaspartate O-methyltransferase